jgi:hypothetical protein
LPARIFSEVSRVELWASGDGNANQAINCQNHLRKRVALDLS